MRGNMKPKKQPPRIDNYKEVRAEAQASANRFGYDYGVELLGDRYRSFMLPRRENRYGHELRCEVVHPEGDCKPGHGPPRSLEEQIADGRGRYP